PEIAGVDAHQGRGRLADRRLVIGDVSPVSGADLDEAGAALGHDVGDTKAAADFHELAPRYDNLAPPGEGHEDEQQGRGVVVDGDRGLGAGDPGYERVDVFVAAAAFTRRQIEFEIAVATADRFHGSAGGVGEGRPAEVGVNDHARGVDHRPEG